MDACALALALGTAGLVAMTVLGFHHRPTAAPARRDGAEAPAPPTKLPARNGQQAIQRLGCIFEQRYSREPGGAA
jgi:hypothetical protein